MLLGNYTQLNANPGKNIGGFTNPYQRIKVSNAMLFYLGNHIISNVTDHANIYTGYRPPYAIVLAPKSGELAAINSLQGSGSITYSNLAGGLNAEATILGSSTLTATINALGVITSALAGTGSFTASITGSLEATASLIGTGSLTAALGSLNSILSTITGTGTLSASIAGSLEASASLSGTGTLVANITGVLNAIANLAGIGTITSNITGAWFMSTTLNGTGSLVASLTSIANMVSNLIGTGSLTANINAMGNIDADIIIGASDPLSPENLALAVWESLATDFNNVGTMGEIMNNMGAVSSPWDVTLEGVYTAGEMMKILTAVAAGKSTIVNLGGGNATVTFRDINDTKDRIIADMTNSERITITKDVL